MKTKFLYFTKICFFIYLLLTFIQLSFASFKSELKLDENKIKLSAITYKVFEKEFIFTNSTSDYYRTLKRLILNYNIAVPEEKLPDIFLPLTKIENDYVEKIVSSLLIEAYKFSYYKDNKYYHILKKILSNRLKLNISTALEIALVDKSKRVSAIPTPYSNIKSSEIRYLHLLKQARYEIVSAVLYDLSKIN